MFTIHIVTPQKVYADFEAKILNLRTTDGQIGLLMDHMSYIATLVESEMNFVDEYNIRHHYLIGEGVVYFDNNVANLLLDRINPIEKV